VALQRHFDILQRHFDILQRHMTLQAAIVISHFLQVWLRTSFSASSRGFLCCDFEASHLTRTISVVTGVAMGSGGGSSKIICKGSQHI